MSRYYVNRNAQPSGDHEVHTTGCSFMPAEKNCIYLGIFESCGPAVKLAKAEHFPKSDGCAYCCPRCNKGWYPLASVLNKFKTIEVIMPRLIPLRDDPNLPCIPPPCLYRVHRINDHEFGVYNPDTDIFDEICPTLEEANRKVNIIHDSWLDVHQPGGKRHRLN